MNFSNEPVAGAYLMKFEPEISISQGVQVHPECASQFLLKSKERLRPASSLRLDQRLLLQINN